MWCNKFQFTQKGGGFALCIVCRSDFNVEHGGENNSNIHKDTSKPKRYVDAVQQQRKLTNFGASSTTEQAFFWFSGWTQPPFEKCRLHCLTIQEHVSRF